MELQDEIVLSDHFPTTATHVLAACPPVDANLAPRKQIESRRALGTFASE
eukprot:CAMPEP_0180527350 /NCGR_PEP_ID=MMETSP1036_2-20121128/60188_1 /TAXON_ID=632150 /ORGANISM="Azadinium spinosum, Strain 3D9" /LENGTH=49 /DNA_ID= /DNA_START= /DNA_END= /DNA_ORIENTATION=